MDVFDTNVWTLGFTETDPIATDLVETVRDDEREVSVSAYIFCEAMTALEQADYVQPSLVAATLSNLAAFWYEHPYAHLPTDARQFDGLVVGVVRFYPGEPCGLLHHRDLDRRLVAAGERRPLGVVGVESFRPVGPEEHRVRQDELRVLGDRIRSNRLRDAALGRLRRAT